MSTKLLNRRADCDLSPGRRYFHTLQLEGRTIKHWHGRPNVRSPETFRLADARGLPTWTWIPVTDRFGLVCISCALSLGLIKQCSVGSLPIKIRDWIYIPASDDADAHGLLVAACDLSLDAAQLGQDLVLETSFLSFCASARSHPVQILELPSDVRCAILVMLAGRAIVDADASLWQRSWTSSNIQSEARERPISVVLLQSMRQIEVRGVLGVGAWPITLFTDKAPSRLLAPARLRLSNADEDGEVIFALTVDVPEDGEPLSEPYFLLATDGVYSLRVRDWKDTLR